MDKQKLIKAYKRVEDNIIRLWLDGTQMRFRNFKCNKKGKLESCECYFAEYRNVITEVK